MPLGNCALGGSGIDIFIKSGDRDLFGDSSDACELTAKAFLIADGPSGIVD